MPTRMELKNRAKEGLRANYWLCVGASILIALIVGAVTGAAAFMPLLAVFVIAPISLGGIIFFLMIYQGGKPGIELIFDVGFSGNYLRKVGGYFWMLLWTFLWSLLFVIPGIIKAYSYAMTPYILAAYPEVKAKDALKLSMRIMRGHKMEYFILQLSFIGWELLSALTAGILGWLYVAPYQSITYSGYYSELLAVSYQSGIVRAEELSGEQPVL